MLKFDKQQFMLSLKDDIYKTWKPISENGSTILMIGAIGMMGLGAFKMWKAVPEAQEEIAAKRYRDESITKLEAVAVAAPYMAVPVGCFVTAAGMMIGSDYISRARLASASLTIAGLTASNQKLQEKFKEYVGEKKLQQAKQEIVDVEHKAQNLVPLNAKGGGNICDLELNKLYRCVISDLNIEFYATQMFLAGLERYLKTAYGQKQENQWLGEPVSLNAFLNLVGRDLGMFGNNIGWRHGGNFKIGIAPARDPESGELYLIIDLPSFDKDWDKPW